MNCGTCKHWTLVGDLGQQGYGQCAARSEPYRSAVTTGAQVICKIGKFEKAPIKVVQARGAQGGTLL